MTAKVVDASALGALLLGEPDAAAIADVRVGEADLAEVTGIAGRSGLTVHAASYLWWARMVDSELVTLHQRLEAVWATS
jgi:predicted nucleic acid-binding protein